MAEKILVVGGAGYIGSHMVKLLRDREYAVTVLDNLSTGHKRSVLVDDFVIGDMSDHNLVDAIFKTRKIDAVMHFAACVDVGESVRDPGKYYENNVADTIKFLNSMVRFGIRRMIFSSTCSVYGIPDAVPISEACPTKPINPYGESKLWVERVLVAYERAYGLKSYRLRYFNAAGADPEGQIGELHEPETHLIPLALKVANGELPVLHILGEDYDTLDGTGVRDYVHVMDLCEAHRLALLDLLANGEGGILNIGIGNGFSVKQIIDSIQQVTGRTVQTKISPRRLGEPASLVANPEKIKKLLGWAPKYTEINDIIRHAWAWETEGRKRFAK